MHHLTVALSQSTPVWLQKQPTLDLVVRQIHAAADQGAGLVVFGEAFVPGYPFWLAFTGGAKFDDPIQKAWYAHYVEHSVDTAAGDLDLVCAAARERNIAVYLGIMERAADRGGHSLYCTLVYIDAQGAIQSTHRKLQPTYEERLVWAQGDGHGLQVHEVGPFRAGGLNCWENWMPLSRTALYAQGENLHVAVWPGNGVNTGDITRFIARESRSYVLSVSGMMRAEDVPADLPHREELLAQAPEVWGNGGSAIAGPDGEWVLEPQVGTEGLFLAELDIRKVWAERQNFDPVGHYSRPDVTGLYLNRDRQSLLRHED